MFPSLARALTPRPGHFPAHTPPQIGFGFVQDWYVLIPLRLLLGLFEAGYFPGVVYLI